MFHKTSCVDEFSCLKRACSRSQTLSSLSSLNSSHPSCFKELGDATGRGEHTGGTAVVQSDGLTKESCSRIALDMYLSSRIGRCVSGTWTTQGSASPLALFTTLIPLNSVRS